jgi:hypothetical protein
MAHLKYRLLMMAACVILAEMTQPGDAHAESFFIPGATAVRVHFGSTLDSVVGAVPGIDVGTPVIGSLVYEADSPTFPQFGFPVIDFFLSVGDIDFTMEDVLGGHVLEFPSTAGFDAQVQLRGRPGLGAFSESFSLEIFQEFGDSNLFLTGQDFTAFGAGLNLTFEGVAPIPEPSSLVLCVTALCAIAVSRAPRRAP